MRRSVNIIDFIALISFYADAIIWILGRRQTSGGGTFVEEENIIQFIDVIRTFRYLIVTYFIFLHLIVGSHRYTNSLDTSRSCRFLFRLSEHQLR